MASKDRKWLEDAFRKIGLGDQAKELAEWEQESDTAELAKRLWLQMNWRDTIERWRDARTLRVYPQARRLLDAGADAETLRLLCGAVALDTLAVIEHHTDYGFDQDVDDDFPGWRLMEVDEDEELTGKVLGGLHETGLEADPKREEGREFWKADDDAPGIDFSTEPTRQP